MNSLRPFQQRDLSENTINLTTFVNADETDLGIFKGHKEAVQIVLDGGHDPDGFYAGHNPVQAVFTNKV